MSEDLKENLFVGAVLIAAFVIGLLVGTPTGVAYGYRQGQIDALEGRIKYRPTTQVVYEEAK